MIKSISAGSILIPKESNRIHPLLLRMTRVASDKSREREE